MTGSTGFFMLGGCKVLVGAMPIAGPLLAGVIELAVKIDELAQVGLYA